MIRRPPRSTLFPYTDALPISKALVEYIGIYPTVAELAGTGAPKGIDAKSFAAYARNPDHAGPPAAFSEYEDRKSTRLNSSHLVISYAVFCLKKKKIECLTSSVGHPFLEPRELDLFRIFIARPFHLRED